MSINKLKFRLKAFTSSVLLLLTVASISAQEYMPPTSTPPAGDYEPQGEYFGMVTSTKAKLGAWVVARGSSRFDVVILPGGLLSLFPGDTTGGWNGTTKFSATNVSLSGTTFSASFTGGYVLTTLTGTGANRILSGTSGGNAFVLYRKTGVNGQGGLRQSPTFGLRPEGKVWSTGFQSMFNSATASADLTKWSNRDNGVQLKHGDYLYRGVVSKGTIGTCYLHIEARAAFAPTASGQGRGNSGIYLRGMHELQVLDSFGLTGESNEVGAIYGVRAPKVNAALPPLTWQVYDCYYTAGSGTNGIFTVYVNGVLVQDATPVSVVTEAGFNGTTLYLQNHGNEVIYNNIWIIPNATTTSLPWATISPVTKVNPYAIKAWKPTFSQVQSYFNLMGRKIDGKNQMSIKLLKGM